MGAETFPVHCIHAIFPIKKLCLWCQMYGVALPLKQKVGVFFCIGALHRIYIFSLSRKSHRRKKYSGYTGCFFTNFLQKKYVSTTSALNDETEIFSHHIFFSQCCTIFCHLFDKKNPNEKYSFFSSGDTIIYTNRNTNSQVEKRREKIVATLASAYAFTAFKVRDFSLETNS